MISTLMVLMLIAAVLLIIVILVQNPKGGGIASEYGSSTNQMFGVQKTTDTLEKLSWGFFSFILIGALATAVLSKSINVEGGNNSDVNVETAVSTPATPAAPSTLPSTAPAATPSAAPATLPATPAKK